MASVTVCEGGVDGNMYLHLWAAGLLVTVCEGGVDGNFDYFAHALHVTVTVCEGGVDGNGYWVRFTFYVPGHRLRRRCGLKLH